MNNKTTFKEFMDVIFPEIQLTPKEEALIFHLEKEKGHFFFNTKGYNKIELNQILSFYILYKVGIESTPQNVVILSKNVNKPDILKYFKDIIDSSRFSNLTKSATSINFTSAYIETLNSKIFIKSSINSLIGIKADLMVVGEGFEDSFYELIPFVKSRKVIFKFLKPKEKEVEKYENFFNIAKEKSFSSSIFENVEEIISKIGRRNLSEVIFFVLEEHRNKSDSFFEHDLQLFLQNLEIMHHLDDLRIRKNLKLLFEKFDIDDIVEEFEILFPSWENFCNYQNERQRNDVEGFSLKMYLLKLKLFVEDNLVISSSSLKTNKIHTECFLAFNKVFFSNLDKIIEELEKK